MCLELILNSVNINFVTFSDIFNNRQLREDSFFIVSSICRNRKSIRINQLNLLNK